MSGGIARARLTEERKSWRKNHPYGFVAKPKILHGGTVDMMVWDCVIPGKAGTAWEGGNYPLTLHFDENYPSQPPVCRFPRDFFHLNVHSCGTVCLSILDPHGGWSPAISVKQILIGIQDLLDDPNPSSAANFFGHAMYTKDAAEYERRVRQQAKQYPAPV